MAKALIKPTRDIWGATAEPMKFDETTPPCSLCGKPHVGVLSPAYMIVRGNFHHIEKLGITVFKPSRKADVMYVELPGGSLGWAVDIQEGSETAAAVHDVCADLAKSKLYALREVTEEELVYGDFEGSEIEDEEQERLDDRPAIPYARPHGSPEHDENEGEGGEEIDP